MQRILFGLSVLLVLCSYETVWCQSIVTFPLGGEVLKSGSEYKIAWDTHYVSGRVAISLWDGEKWLPIASGVSALDGVLRWIVPENLVGNRFRIKVSDGDLTPGNSSVSTSYFTIAKSAASTPAHESVAPQPARMTLFPNPALNGSVKCVWTRQPREISLYTILGNRLEVHPIEPEMNSIQLRTNTLSPGTYYIRTLFIDSNVETHALTIP